MSHLVNKRAAALVAAVVVTCSAASASPVAILNLAGHRFAIEVAATPAARRQGLMGRQHLAPDAGMWFVFQDTTPRSFWMKDTPLPVDILFFDAQRHLVAMQLNVPPCRQAPCPLYPSGAPAKFVLEVAAGTARRLRVRIGDQAHLDRLPTNSTSRPGAK